jgi:hypothetical protein
VAGVVDRTVVVADPIGADKIQSSFFPKPGSRQYREPGFFFFIRQLSTTVQPELLAR